MYTLCMYVCMYVLCTCMLCVCMYVCMHACMYVLCTCMSYVCMLYVCMYVCIYVCMYVHAHMYHEYGFPCLMLNHNDSNYLDLPTYDSIFVGAVTGFANLGEIYTHLSSFKRSLDSSELSSVANSMLVIFVRGSLQFPYICPVSV